MISLYRGCVISRFNCASEMQSRKCRMDHVMCVGFESTFSKLVLFVLQKLTHEDEQVKKELKAYTSSDPNVKKNTLREMYNTKMNEQISHGKVRFGRTHMSNLFSTSSNIFAYI